MAKNKEQAEARYAEAQEKARAAREELRDARRELDKFLVEEEAERHAVYLGFEKGDEAGVQAAKTIIRQRRAFKEQIKAQAREEVLASDGPIGGLS